MRRAVLCNLSTFQRQRYPASSLSYFSPPLSSNTITKSPVSNVEKNYDRAKNLHCRQFTSTQVLSNKDDHNDAAKQHDMFQEQLRELSNERSNLFGSDSEDGENSNPLQLPQDDEAKILSPSMDQQELEQLGKEREALFHFEKEEIQAWTNEASEEGEGAATIHSKALMEKIRIARSERDAALERQKAALAKSYADYNIHQPKERHHDEKSGDGVASASSTQSNFTHLSPKAGDSSYNATMVDVGSKKATHRIAVAQSIVVFPPEVMDEFQISDENERGKGEMVGPKGPIFETARLAGIMGAKKTQDLIPLCHPLPLNYVNITINLEKNKAIIECECRVTHRTGVEMEALTGASIAALTIYDMVKAVSHRVRIEGTTLISKTGGKRDVSSYPTT